MNVEQLIEKYAKDNVEAGLASSSRKKAASLFLDALKVDPYNQEAK